MNAAARGIQRLPPQLPISTAGPPCAAGHGVRLAAPTFSPRQSRRITGSAAWQPWTVPR